MLKAEVATRQLSRLEGWGVRIWQPRIRFYSRLSQIPTELQASQSQQPKRLLSYSLYLFNEIHISFTVHMTLKKGWYTE